MRLSPVSFPKGPGNNVEYLGHVSGHKYNTNESPMCIYIPSLVIVGDRRHQTLVHAAVTASARQSSPHLLLHYTKVINRITSRGNTRSDLDHWVIGIWRLAYIHEHCLLLQAAVSGEISEHNRSKIWVFPESNQLHGVIFRFLFYGVGVYSVDASQKWGVTFPLESFERLLFKLQPVHL